MHATTPRAPRGFTLVELLVVIAIIGLVSAVALPVVLPALNERRISEGARLLQAVLAGARDNAVRAGAPRGVRLLIDPIFNGNLGFPLASNRMIAIEPGPDYSEGKIRVPDSTNYFINGVDTGFADPAYTSPGTTGATFLRVATSGPTDAATTGMYNSPTGWSYNIRQGDKIRFNDSGNYYTIVGPAPGVSGGTNPERFIICPPPSTSPPVNTDLTTWRAEYLILTNGIDDDGDGWIDESCDGIDNDDDGVIDPAFDGIDNDGDGTVDNADEMLWNKNSGSYNLTSNEYEPESLVGVQSSHKPTNDTYAISRRPVISQGARETALPDGIVIDLTTWNAALSTGLSANQPLLPERSRLPVDPYTRTVDIMISPNGQVVLPGAGNGGSFAKTPIANTPFYHFWLTEREGVNLPLWDPPGSALVPSKNPNLSATPPQTYLLPMPKGTSNYSMPNSVDDPGKTYSTNPVFLTGGRRLVTLFTKTGQVMTNSIETFDVNDTNRPYYAAQTGIKEPQ